MDLIPNDIRRDFDLMRDLDREANELQKELAYLESAFLDRSRQRRTEGKVVILAPIEPFLKDDGDDGSNNNNTKSNVFALNSAVSPSGGSSSAGTPTTARQTQKGGDSNSNSNKGTAGSGGGGGTAVGTNTNTNASSANASASKSPTTINNNNNNSQNQTTNTNTNTQFSSTSTTNGNSNSKAKLSNGLVRGSEDGSVLSDHSKDLEGAKMLQNIAALRNRIYQRLTQVRT